MICLFCLICFTFLLSYLLFLFFSFLFVRPLFFFSWPSCSTIDIFAFFNIRISHDRDATPLFTNKLLSNVIPTLLDTEMFPSSTLMLMLILTPVRGNNKLLFWHDFRIRNTHHGTSFMSLGTIFVMIRDSLLTRVDGVSERGRCMYNVEQR